MICLGPQTIVKPTFVVEIELIKRDSVENVNLEMLGAQIGL